MSDDEGVNIPHVEESGSHLIISYVLLLDLGPLDPMDVPNCHVVENSKFFHGALIKNFFVMWWCTKGKGSLMVLNGVAEAENNSAQQHQC